MRGFKEEWLFKKGTAEYYREALSYISAIACDYDGYDTKDAAKMKELVDDLRELANKALCGKCLWFSPTMTRTRRRK